MKIAFIRPNMNDVRSADAIHPLELSVLLGLTPDDIDVTVYDERLEAIPDSIDCDLAAITAQTFTARRAYEIADGLRARGVPVVLGGYHPSFMPAEAGRHADAVVIGEAEDTWPRVVADARRGRLKKVYRGGGHRSLAGVRYERRHFADKKYQMVFPVEFNRGCRFDCDFCSVSAFHGAKHHARPVDDVVREIAEAGAKYILMVDDNILCNKERTKELFRAMIPLKVRWGCQISLDVARDPELLSLMAQSGCIAALIGFESLSGSNLRQMRKGVNVKRGDFRDDIAKIRDHGIMIYGSFVFGYDDDGPDIFDRTVDFALDERFFLCNFNTLNPMPGTRLYERFRKEGRLVDEAWWLDRRFQYGEVMFQPRGMSADELREGCIGARERFYRYGNIARRFFDRRANCNSLASSFLYLATNVVARREIITKMGQLRQVRRQG